MKQLVEKFPDQLREAMQIGSKVSLPAPKDEIRNVLITGLGGSGIGGTIAAEIVAAECPVPIIVNKDYFIPRFVNRHTLVIVSSYSGNTEETLHALQGAISEKAQIVCITSGGKVAEIAKQHSLPLIIIPGGMPPRACLGYSLTQLFFVLHGLKLTGDKFKAELDHALNHIEREQDQIISQAKEIADYLSGKIPVIYASDGYNGVATRFRQQLNENSKMLCWHHVLPEMNHNELVGWAEKHPELAVLILRNDTDYTRTQARMEISKEVFAKYTPHVREVWSRGDTFIGRTIYLIHLLDWVSVFLADLKKIDATEVNIIDHLKGELAKI